MKTFKNCARKTGKLTIAFFLVVVTLLGGNQTIRAQDYGKITIYDYQLDGKFSKGHDLKFAIDGDKKTYFQTPEESSNEDHYRYLDIDLDSLYEIKEIKMFMNEDTYQHYQIYASETGEKYDKVIFKDDNTVPSLEEGISHVLDTPVKASKLRINLSYNSAGMQGNIAELELYGKKIGEEPEYTSNIEVKNFDETEWSKEYEKFENDKTYAKNKTEEELTAMVGRVIGKEWQDDFIFEVKDFGGKDMYEISNGENGKIVVRGNDGVSLASGWNYYLRYYCNVDYNPLFVSNLDMPENLPRLDKKIVKETQYDVRYALNFCTYSYSMAFWDWDQYEEFLDWAAMSGVNLMLDIVGQEEIIRRTLSEYGYSDEEIKEYICGPGYFAWYYMQNMTSYGGPLPDDWFENRVELGRKMHDRMQTLGISPALSGFSGMVPTDFKEKNPDAVIVDQGGWPYDGAFERPDMLRVYVEKNQTDYFDKLADTFYQAQKDVFGDITDYYAVDPFHEGGKTGDMNLTKVYTTVQNKMLEHDPNGIWVIQQWSGSLNDDKLSGLTQKEHALILDLSSEYNSYASVMERNEVPWVWNMIHAFGGKPGLEANVQTISQNIPSDYEKYNYMVGIGMTMESLERCPMIYEMLWDMAWTKDPIDPMEWGKKYLERSYGKVNEELMQAWSIMLNTIYDNRQNDVAESLTNARPTENFSSTSSWGRGTINYDTKEFEKVLKIYIDNYEEFKDSDRYIYDMADITRQVLSNSSINYHKLMMDAYRAKDINLFDKYSQHFLDLIQLQNDVLDTTDIFQTGIWLNEARTMIEDADDWTKDLFEFNARSLITTWGGKRTADYGGLRDYSYRQWAGLTEDFYLKRWEIWVDNYHNALVNGTSPKSINWFNFEWEWANRKSDEGYSYPEKSESSFDLGELAKKAYNEFSITNIDDFATENEESSYGNLLLGKKAVVEGANLTQEEISSLSDGNTDTGWIGNEEKWDISFKYDLGGIADIDAINFTLKPIVAGGIEYSYDIEIFVDNQWQKVTEDNSNNLPGKISVNYTGNAEAIRFNFHSTTQIPEFKEFEVYGTLDNQQMYENIALNKTGLIKKSDDSQWTETSKLTDGDYSTKEEFVGPNYDFVPAQFAVDFGKDTYVEKTTVHFEKAGLRFQFVIYGEKANGDKILLLDMSKNTEDIEQSYTLEVNDEIQKIVVDLQNRAEGGSFYLACSSLFEIEAFVPTNNDQVNLPVEKIAPENATIKRLESESKVENANNLIDNDLSTYEGYDGVNYAFVPAQYVIDLGEEKYIDSTNIHFEKAGLRFQFTVYGEKANGEKTKLLDMSQNKEDMKKTYTIDVKDDYRRIIVDLTGRAEGGIAYLASCRLYEIEVFGNPTNIVPEAEVTLSGKETNELNDDDYSTGITLSKEDNKEIIITFDKEKDLYALGLFNDNAAIAYRLYYWDNETEGNWVSILDESKNEKESTMTFKTFKKPILTNKVKLEILNERLTLNEIALYKKNFTSELLSRVDYLLKTMNEDEVGEYAGNYGHKEYEAFMNKVNELKTSDLSKYNSEDVKKEIDNLDALYLAYKTSYVTVSRDDLLNALLTAEALLKTESNCDFAFLKEEYNKANDVYNTYKVTQEQINTAEKSLNVSVEKAINMLSLEEQLKAEIAIAETLLENVVIGDRPGNYEAKVVEEFRKTVEEIKSSMNTAGSTEELNALNQRMKEAIDEFKRSAVIVDKTQLVNIVAEAKQKEEYVYTADSYKLLQEAVKKAENVLKNENSSVSEVNEAVSLVKDCLENLVMLNREGLQLVLQEANNLVQSDYSASSWSAFETTFKEAQSLIEKVSLNQSEIDEMQSKLENCMKKLVKLDRSKLQHSIEKVQKLNGNDYTSESWNKLLTSLKEANDIISNVSVEQSDLDKVQKKLDDAIKDLEKKQNNNGSGSSSSSNGTNQNKPGHGELNEENSQNNDGGVQTGVQTNTAAQVLLLITVSGAVITVLKRRKKEN